MEKVFITQAGKIKDYVSPIFTDSKTTDKKVISLQTKMNVEIQRWLNEPATDINQASLWNGLTYIFKENQPTDKQDAKYLEIIESMQEIGKSIAYISRRVVEFTAPVQYKQDFCNAVDRTLDILAEGTVPCAVLDSYKKWMISSCSADMDRANGTKKIQAWAKADKKGWECNCMETITKYLKWKADKKINNVSSEVVL